VSTALAAEFLTPYPFFGKWSAPGAADLPTPFGLNPRNR